MLVHGQIQTRGNLSAIYCQKNLHLSLLLTFFSLLSNKIFTVLQIVSYCCCLRRDALCTFGISKGIAGFWKPPRQMPLWNPSIATTSCDSYQFFCV